MGIYAEKRDKLVARIEELTKRIATDTAKKQELEEKLKEVNRLAMAEERGCKPRELDDIINAEHSLLQKLRASGLSDSELLELVGVVSADVASDWLELAGPSVRLELFGASSARLELTIVSDELMELGAGSLPCSELAEVESSQAFNVNAAAMPKL